MSGIEYLNLRSYRDLARIRRELLEQGQTMPPEQALSVYRMYRPEIVAFTTRRTAPVNKVLQKQIDMDMASLLLKQAEPESLEEAQAILSEAVQCLCVLVKRSDEPDIWHQVGMCCHMLIECFMGLHEKAKAEACCRFFHDVCRNLSRSCGGKLAREGDVQLLYHMYEDTVWVLEDAVDSAKRIHACRVKMRLQRCKLWQCEIGKRAKHLELARSYRDIADEFYQGDSHREWTLALHFYGKAIAIYRLYRHLPEVRWSMAGLWRDMAATWERFENEESLLKAKDCLVKAVEDTRICRSDCLRRGLETRRASNLMRACYLELSELCKKLPGEKNLRKADKYASLAGEVDEAG